VPLVSKVWHSVHCAVGDCYLWVKSHCLLKTLIITGSRRNDMQPMVPASCCGYGHLKYFNRRSWTRCVVVELWAVEKQLWESCCEKSRRPFGEVIVAFETKCWTDPHVIHTHMSHSIPSLTNEWTLIVSFLFLHGGDGGEAAGKGRPGVEKHRTP
jgi:hypothetical protein